jgi:hypothetical protein
MRQLMGPSICLPGVGTAACWPLEPPLSSWDCLGAHNPRLRPAPCSTAVDLPQGEPFHHPWHLMDLAPDTGFGECHSCGQW